MPVIPPPPVASRVWLIGLMGSGKSTVGALVAKRLGAPYVDNDVTVASLAGRSSVELAEAGGDLLHEWESRYVHHVVDLAPPVVAGIPASIADRPDDLALLAGRGLLVYLDVDLDTLVSRVEAGPRRPWLHGDPTEVLARMLEKRGPALVSAAGLVVDGNRPAEEVAARVAAGTGSYDG